MLRVHRKLRIARHRTHKKMSLQEIFYIVSIVTMSLFIIFFVALVVLVFFIRAKIDKLILVVEKRVEDIKQLVTNPARIAATVGEAVVDTAINQVEKMTDGRKRRRKK